MAMAKTEDDNDLDIMDQDNDLDDSGDGEEILGMVNESSGNVTYRLVHVGDDGNCSISGNSGATIYHPGQYQVIGSNQEMFNSSGTITIIPGRENSQKIPATMKKRDDRRRATHNEVERRRRDKINNWIARLSKMIPPSSDSNDKPGLEIQSKGGILARACEYISELKESQQKFNRVVMENERLTDDLNAFLVQMAVIKKENEALKSKLKQNGISYASETSEES